MKSLIDHGPVFLALQALTFAVFGYLMGTPIWDTIDFDILCDAHALSHNPGEMFRHAGFYFSQPLLQLGFLLEYRLFGLEPAGYIAVNLLLHGINAFIVFMLVNMLFPKRGMAFLAAAMFALGVGSYGKTLMTIHQLESLLLAGLHLLVLYFFIRNDFRRDGSIRSPLFLLGLGLFLLSGLTKIASFSLIGTLIAYKAFFYRWRRGRAILSPDLGIFVLVGIVFYWAQSRWGYQDRPLFGPDNLFQDFSWISFKNIFRYLNLMFFPMQQSPILKDSSPLVAWIFEARTYIRIFLTLSIVSYSFFGFVFGSRAIRFFIAWTYITLLPFTGTTATGSWLNLNHLYLTSLGFCVILAAGTTGTGNLLRARRWRRHIPYIVPLAFVLTSMTLTYKLNERNRAIAATPDAVEMRQELSRSCGPAAPPPARRPSRLF